jgi:tRNA modification GTPase
MRYTAHDLKNTIVALATPSGVGALGIVRLSGPEAIALVDQVFSGKRLGDQASHTIHFGALRDENGRVVDEVLVSIFHAPRSYTGENVAEISCHGSPYILQEVIRLFTRLGARLARPGEFTMRAFLNGRMDLSQAEAVADLIAAESQAQHAIALRQMRGGFSREIQDLRRQLLDFASLVELELDFSEEDVEFADRSQLRGLILSIQALIQRLLLSFELGNVIKNGVAAVIAGRPNAGKSTLLNALLNEERAIVSEIAGTTRDTIEEILNINGVPFRLIDTAGIREAQDQVEALGVQRTLEKVENSALLLYVFDVIKTGPEEARRDLAQLARPGVPTLVVANKMDLNPYTTWEQYFGETTPGNGFSISKDRWIPVSAANRMNIEYLKEKLFETIVAQGVDLSGTIVSNARHHEALRRAEESLGAVSRGLDAGLSSDLLAIDIRQALHNLGEITGEISTEDLLGNIFSRFCIGK